MEVPRILATARRKAPMQQLNYDRDAEWWIRCGASAFGEQGTTLAFLNMLRFGPPTSSGAPNTAPYSDAQLGTPTRAGSIERARQCSAIWHQISRWNREILMGRYDTRQWPPGIVGRFGDLAGVVVVMVATENASRRVYRATKALDAHADVLDRARESCPPDARKRFRWREIEKLKAAIDAGAPQRSKEIRAFEQALLRQAELEASCQRWIIKSDWETVARTCQNGGSVSMKQIRGWATEARIAVESAHSEWSSVRGRLADDWAR